MQINVKWSDLKNFSVGRNLSIQWIAVNNLYRLAAIDGNMEMAAQILITSPPGTDQADFETNFKSKGNQSPKSSIDVISQPPLTVSSTPIPPPFMAKTVVSNGIVHNLFLRATGIQSTVVTGSNPILFTVPYSWAKITGASIVNGEAGDICNLFILDTATGTYTLAQTGTAVPNAVLNQFGFNLNIAKDYMETKSTYDADVYQGMQIKIVYTSISNKNIGINFMLHQVI